MFQTLGTAICFLVGIHSAYGEDAAHKAGSETKKAAKMAVVTIDTSVGKIDVELDAAKAPVSTENFLKYTDSKHYDGLIFHRVIKGFMIQGGGLNEAMEPKKTMEPIKNEAANGLKNKRGTIAMARTAAVNSATSQFFINTVDNAMLDYRGPKDHEMGYAVFGKVVSGMDVVDKIEAAKTTNKNGHGDVPEKVIKINSIRRKN